MNLLILVVDDEPDVEVLFRQQFRRDIRSGRFTMEFAQSAPMALQRITDAAGVSLILILSDINMPLALGKSSRPLIPVRRSTHTQRGTAAMPAVSASASASKRRSAGSRRWPGRRRRSSVVAAASGGPSPSLPPPTIWFDCRSSSRKRVDRKASRLRQGFCRSLAYRRDGRLGQRLP